MIRFRCSCGRMLAAREEDVGESAKCPVCAALMLVPSEVEAMRQGVSSARPAAPEPARRSGHGWREVDNDDDRRPLDWRRSQRRGRDPEKTSRKARWALLLGVLSPFLCAPGAVAGLAAVILGAMGRREVARSQGELGGGSAALAGLLMGLLGLVVSTGSTLLAWPGLATVREGADRRQNENDLGRVAAALRKYESDFGHLPEAAIYSDDDRPLLSWRVAILRYIGEQALYDEFNLDEPWDSEHNKRLLTRMPKVYQLPGRERADGSTYIQVVTGNNTAFWLPREVPIRLPRRKMRLADFIDGPSNTILVGTAERAVPWTKPEDMVYDGVALPRFSKRFREGHNAAMADGSVRWIKHSASSRAVGAMLTPGGGEFVLPGD